MSTQHTMCVLRRLRVLLMKQHHAHLPAWTTSPGSLQPHPLPPAPPHASGCHAMAAATRTVTEESAATQGQHPQTPAVAAAAADCRCFLRVAATPPGLTVNKEHPTPCQTPCRDSTASKTHEPCGFATAACNSLQCAKPCRFCPAVPLASPHAGTVRFC